MSVRLVPQATFVLISCRSHVSDSLLLPYTRFEGAEEAWQIYSKGPEPLQSQFTASYGMVLNLMSVYTQEEAKEFINKSFGNYLSLDGNRRRQKASAPQGASAAEIQCNSLSKCANPTST